LVERKEDAREISAYLHGDCEVNVAGDHGAISADFDL
jgi:hypothetical protein